MYPTYSIFIILVFCTSFSVIAKNEIILPAMNGQNGEIADNDYYEVVDDDEETVEDEEELYGSEDIHDADFYDTEDSAIFHPQEGDAFFSFMDAPQQAVSAGLKSFASSIDEFFADEKVYYESSGSYLRLTADVIFNEGKEIGYAGDVKLKLRLPRTKKKLKLVVESDADKKDDDVDQVVENTPIQAVEEKDFFAGIQATLGDENRWRFRPSIGLRLGSDSGLYTKFRANRKYQFENWQLRWHETIFWFDSTGWGLDTLFESDRKIGDELLFRSSTFDRWSENLNYHELSQVFSLYDTLSQNRSISYEAGVYGTSEPTVHANEYLLQIRYRQNVHKDYLFLELIPQVRYKKINEFDPEHYLIFRIEMIFHG